MNDPVASLAGLAQQELTASVQALALPKGLYAFSVKSADPKPVAELGGLMLPAIHIGVGPSVPARAIEFLSGRDEGSPWLYAPGDTLVAKVLDAQVTLFLTSVRRAGAEPLDVEIERLDARHEPDAQARRSRPAQRQRRNARSPCACRSLPISATAAMSSLSIRNGLGGSGTACRSRLYR
jgi:hypothetical protein